MPNLKGRVATAIALSSVAAAAFSQALPPPVLACASVDNDIARLECFDREVARFGGAATVVAPTQSIAPSGPPPTANVATAPQTEVAPPNADFGLSGDLRRRKIEEERKTRPVAEELTAVVTKVTERPHGELVLELDNGQVWTQPEKKFGTIIKAGEKVRITQGAMNSFFLSTDAGTTTRIRRIR